MHIALGVDNVPFFRQTLLALQIYAYRATGSVQHVRAAGCRVYAVFHTPGPVPAERRGGMIASGPPGWRFSRAPFSRSFVSVPFLKYCEERGGFRRFFFRSPAFFFFSSGVGRSAAREACSCFFPAVMQGLACKKKPPLSSGAAIACAASSTACLSSIFPAHGSVLVRHCPHASFLSNSAARPGSFAVAPSRTRRDFSWNRHQTGRSSPPPRREQAGGMVPAALPGKPSTDGTDAVLPSACYAPTPDARAYGAGMT